MRQLQISGPIAPVSVPWAVERPESLPAGFSNEGLALEPPTVKNKRHCCRLNLESFSRRHRTAKLNCIVTILGILPLTWIPLLLRILYIILSCWP